MEQNQYDKNGNRFDFKLITFSLINGQVYLNDQPIPKVIEYELKSTTQANNDEMILKLKMYIDSYLSIRPDTDKQRNLFFLGDITLHGVIHYSIQSMPYSELHILKIELLVNKRVNIQLEDKKEVVDIYSNSECVLQMKEESKNE